MRSYPEPVVLRDGRTVTLSPITPAAKPLIVAAMANLSEQTSRRRFFTARYRLSDAELERMTALDGISAFALGAVARDAGAPHAASASHATQGMPRIRRRPKWRCSSSTIIRGGARQAARDAPRRRSAIARHRAHCTRWCFPTTT